MTERKVLPEKYRKAFNLKKGMEVAADGGWWEITNVMRIYSPVNEVWLDFANGRKANVNPQDEVMSR